MVSTFHLNQQTTSVPNIAIITFAFNNVFRYTSWRRFFVPIVRANNSTATNRYITPMFNTSRIPFGIRFGSINSDLPTLHYLQQLLTQELSGRLLVVGSKSYTETLVLEHRHSEHLKHSQHHLTAIMDRFTVDSMSNTPDQGGLSFQMMVLLLTLIFLLIFRYTRLIVGIWANLTCKPFSIPDPLTYTPKDVNVTILGSTDVTIVRPALYTPANDVTVVIPTVFKNPSELAECIGRVTACGPKEIFVVVLDSNVAPCRALCDANNFSNITVLGVPKLGKRLQIIRALSHIETEIVVWADDDVFWPEHYLENLIAVFSHDGKVGAAGTCQRVRRSNGTSWWPTNFWNILGISYLERRVFNNLTTNAIDGSISTLSGRSAAYRTSILKCEEFVHYFTTDSWKGKLLNSDDDKCLTRYVFSHGWDIKINRAVCLETTLEESWDYINQCLRWARARFRGNFTVMRKETYWRDTHKWGFYVIYIGMFQQPALLIDALLCYLLTLVVPDSTRSHALVAFGVWLLFTKVVKMIPHFIRNPFDLVWLPALILFGYFHSLLNLYALCTLTQTAWGGKDLTALSKTKSENDETKPLLSDTQTSDTAPTQVSNFVGDGQVSAARST